MEEQKKKSILERIDKKELFFVLLIFLLAFGVRGHLMRYDLPFGFDPYFHARVAGYVAETFTIPQYDWLGYYQLENPDMPKTGAFFWFFTAILYKIFTLGAAFNKELWTNFVKFFPAFFGALISVSMYFLGKEMYGKKAGIVMALFAAIVPAFVYRTMAGTFEEDSLGFLWMVVGLIFFVRAAKPLRFDKPAIINSLVAAVFFAVMAWTWEMFLLIPYIMLAYMGLTGAVMWFRNEEKEKIFSLAKVFVLTMVVFSALTIAFIGIGWLDRFTGYITQYAPISPENIERATTRNTSTVLGLTVGEENTGRQFWGEKYNALIIFPFLALLLIPYRVFRSRQDHLSFIIFFWVLLTMFMAWGKLKFTYTLGLPIAAAAGIVFSEVLVFLGNRTQFEKKTVGIALAFMVLIGLGAASIFVTTKVPNIELNTGWKETLYWLKDSTPTDSKLFNWWDQGHWLTYVAERGTITDNRNLSGEANSAYGLFVIAEDEEEAYSIVKEFGSDYVILGADIVEKLGSIGLYAYNTPNGLDPRVQRLDRSGIIFECNRNADQLSGQVTYQCGGNNFSEAQMLSFPTTYLNAPNQVIDQRNLGFVYRSKDNSLLVVLNPVGNKSMAARLWFNDPNIKHFEEVFYSKQVKVFKVVD